MKYISAIATASLLSISLIGFLSSNAHADNPERQSPEDCKKGQTYDPETQTCREGDFDGVDFY